MEEQIICSAIWYKELPVKDKDIPLLHYLPINCKTGMVFCGHRHMHCQYTMINSIGLRSVESEVGKYVQGFLTNTNRFVDRKEGAEIHVKNGGTLHFGNILYSEDLY